MYGAYLEVCLSTMRRPDMTDNADSFPTLLYRCLVHIVFQAVRRVQTVESLPPQARQSGHLLSNTQDLHSGTQYALHKTHLPHESDADSNSFDAVANSSPVNAPTTLLCLTSIRAKNSRPTHLGPSMLTPAITAESCSRIPLPTVELGSHMPSAQHPGECSKDASPQAETETSTPEPGRGLKGGIICKRLECTGLRFEGEGEWR